MALLLVLALVGAAIGGFFVTRQVVAEQNHRALVERAAAIEASLLSMEQSIASSLRVLGDIASSPEPGAMAVFNRVANDQLLQATAVGAARQVNGRFVTVAGAGTTRPGSALRPEQVSVVRRATTVTNFVAALLPGPPPHLLLALAVGDVVVFQEASLVPSTPDDDEAIESPYAGLDIALFATASPDSLVLATARLPFAGQQVERTITVGVDSWRLVVASDETLVGTFTERVPWFVLGAGLVAALLAGLIVVTLVRRRAYALHLVADRTADLERARQFQESLLLSGPVMVSRLRSSDYAVTYVSPNVTRLLGLDPDDVASNPPGGAPIHPEDRTMATAAIIRVLDGLVASETLEFRSRTGTGDYRWVADVIVPERDATTGEITGVLSYVTDIDDRKSAEVALRAAQENAESANQAKSEFLSRMSHELRTPMNAVLGFGQLLERDTLTPDQHESVSYILTAGRHLLELIDEVLDISRIEAGTMSLSFAPIPAIEVVGEAMELIRPFADARGIRLELAEGTQRGMHVLADRQRLKQILLNLLSNAVKYNVEGGLVSLSVLEPTPGTVRVTVTDTGPGLSPEQRALLFAPFQRLGAEHGEVEGTGIGLALSRQLAEAMGGTLDVSSTPGQGSTFGLQLPAAASAPLRVVALPAPQEAQLAVPEGVECILQIEDNPSNARLMHRVLADHPGVQLVVAERGRLGIELAREHQPRLILLDLHLPDVAGDEVLRRLRSDPTTADIPVVVVSADGTQGQEERLRSAGANAYLTKPFDLDELLSLIDGTLATP